MNEKRTRKGSFIKGLVGGIIAMVVIGLVGANILLSKDDAVKKLNAEQQQSASTKTQVPEETQESKATEQPTEEPTAEPTEQPTEEPTEKPTEEPTKEPSEEVANILTNEGMKYLGVSEAGKEDTYDALAIAKKLAKYDYKNNGKKMVFLTFDDGASTTVTPKILKVLNENDVKATFFVTGANIKRGGAAAKKLIKQEFDEGHAIANHSYSHDYGKLYPENHLNLNNFLKDYAKTDKMLKQILGEDFGTRVIRCPGGYMTWKNMGELTKYMNENNMASIDWNALSKDAEGKKKNAKQLYQNAVSTAKGKEIVVMLMHDTYGKEETAKALPDIIKYFKEKGYEFKTLS